MNDAGAARKDQLINDVLILWNEEPVDGRCDERLKQELRVCGPALRVYMSFEAFEVRKSYFTKCEEFAAMEEVIRKGTEKLADYIALGKFLVGTGLDYSVGGKQLKQTPATLSKALQDLIEKENKEYSEESQVALDEELPGAIRGIEFFIMMYD